MRAACGQDLIGKVLVSITKTGNDELLFVTNENKRFKMYQGDDCAGFIIIEEITGNLETILNSPIILAKRKVYSNNSLNPDEKWFLYTIGTTKGSIQIKWFVSNNGCFYFRGVDFDELTESKFTKQTIVPKPDEPEKKTTTTEKIWFKETLKETPRRKKRDRI